MNISRRSRWLAILIGVTMMLMQILMATVPHHRAGRTIDTHSRPFAHITSGDFHAPALDRSPWISA